MRWVSTIKKKFARLWPKGRSRTPGSSEAAPKWDPARTALALKYLSVGVAIVGPIAIWGYAEETLSQYVSDRYALVPAPATVHLLDTPAWVPLAQQDLFRKLVADQFRHGPLERSSLERARQVVASSPWVESVERVERSGATVEVEAQYRRPAALVKAGEGYRLIDASGVLLPGLYQPERLPIIEGVTAAPPREGSRWPGTQIQTALTMIRLAATQTWVNQVRAFDVGQADSLGRTRIVLWTAAGRDPARDPHVVWGLPPGQERPVEPDAATKLAWLAGIARQNQSQGTIDAGHRIVELFGGTAFTRDPLPPVADQVAGARYTLLR